MLEKFFLVKIYIHKLQVKWRTISNSVVVVGIVVVAEKRPSSKGGSSPWAKRLVIHVLFPQETLPEFLFCSVLFYLLQQPIFIMMRQVQYAQYIGGSSALQVEYCTFKRLSSPSLPDDGIVI